MPQALQTHRCRALLRTIAPAVVLLAWLFPGAAAAQCSEELTAVLLIDGIHPGTDLQFRILDIAKVGVTTDPSDAQLLAAVQAVYAHDPSIGTDYHAWRATAADFHLYTKPAADFGAATIIDRRTARVVFAGGVTWDGTGRLVVPAAATHSCQIVPGDPAAPPPVTWTFPNGFWWSSWGTLEQLTQRGIDFARQTDLLHSFADCGPYAVAGFTYTPTVGQTDPRRAVQVLVVSGRAGAAWMPVARSEISWGAVKAHYRGVGGPDR